MVGHHTAVGTGLTVDAIVDNIPQLHHHHAQHHHGLHQYTTTSNITEAVLMENNLDNLYPALVQCFGIILLGFIAGKFSIISDVEAKGLGTFIGTFSLPALIFVSMCQLDFNIVNWVFLASITLAKSIIFFAVLFVSLFLHKPLDPSRSALYAIFCTQSNDFALGFPILQAIYGTKHPDYPMYLYLLAPVSLAFLNPIGFILMEIGKFRDSSSGDLSKIKIIIKVTQAIFKNPILMMTVLGIIGNLVFHSQMPDIIHNFMQTLGSAFSASALFLLGLRMVSSGSGQNSSSRSINKTSLMVPFVLITMKSLVLPIITREIVYQFNAGKDVNETIDLSNYAFLYGTIPTAPSVFVYATNYNMMPDMIASTITASTFIAAPLMFVTAKLLTLMNMDPADYIPQLDVFLLDVSVVGILAAGWVVFVLIVTGKVVNFPHRITFLLTIFQGIGCLGAALWSLLDCRHGWRLYLQFIVFGYGVFGARVCTCVLAVTILMLQTRGVCAVTKHRHLLLVVCTVIPAIMVLGLTVKVAVETPEHGDKQDPNFQYGETQTVTALVTLMISLTVTLLCMILGHRYQLPPHSRDSLHCPDGGDESSETDGLLSDEGNVIQETSVEIEDLMLGGDNNGNDGSRGCGNGGRYRCDSEHRKYCSGLIRRYEVPPAEEALSPESILQTSEDSDDYQLLRHNILLLLLCISMFVGAALCIWTLVMDQFTGIYLELVFLDGFLNLGQSIFTLALFGVNAKGIVVKVKYYVRKLLYGREQIMLPPWEDLDQTTRAVSTMFIKHHMESCMSQVLHDLTVNMRLHRAVVTGQELVTWLQERGLVLSRQDGEVFGRHLLRGRVLRHVDNHLDFYDDRYVYTFQPVD